MQAARSSLKLHPIQTMRTAAHTISVSPRTRLMFPGPVQLERSLLAERRLQLSFARE